MTHTHTHTYTHTCIGLAILHVYMCNTYMHAFMHTCTPSTCTHVIPHALQQQHAHTHTRTHTQAHTLTHLHTHTHKYTHSMYTQRVCCLHRHTTHSHAHKSTCTQALLHFCWLADGGHFLPHTSLCEGWHEQSGEAAKLFKWYALELAALAAAAAAAVSSGHQCAYSHPHAPHFLCRLGWARHGARVQASPGGYKYAHQLHHHPDAWRAAFPRHCRASGYSLSIVHGRF